MKQTDYFYWERSSTGRWIPVKVSYIHFHMEAHGRKDAPERSGFFRVDPQWNIDTCITMHPAPIEE